MTGNNECGLYCHVDDASRSQRGMRRLLDAMLVAWVARDSDRVPFKTSTFMMGQICSCVFPFVYVEWPISAHSCKRHRHFGQSLRQGRFVCGGFAPNIGCFLEFGRRRGHFVCSAGSHMSMTILIDVMQNEQSRPWRNPRLLQSTASHTSHSNRIICFTLPVSP